MKYIKLVIAVDDHYQEALIAELLELDFDAFEQQEDKLITYVIKERFNDVNREQIEQLLAAFIGDGYIEAEEIVDDQNWNEEWEQTVSAQQIGQFLVKPTWDSSVAINGMILLEIDPKMAFGTGYHETTRLMLKMLPEVIVKDCKVLDAGTGTGILAIASVKLGADEVFAFDNDDWSITNSKENVLLNDVSNQITIQKGSVEVIPEEASFDVVLANIEKNTILEFLPELSKVLKGGGNMLLSGLLERDKDALSMRITEFDLNIKEISQENEWIALLLNKAV